MNHCHCWSSNYSITSKDIGQIVRLSIWRCSYQPCFVISFSWIILFNSHQSQRRRNSLDNSSKLVDFIWPNYLFLLRYWFALKEAEIVVSLLNICEQDVISCKLGVHTFIIKELLDWGDVLLVAIASHLLALFLVSFKSHVSIGLHLLTLLIL